MKKNLLSFFLLLSLLSISLAVAQEQQPSVSTLTADQRQEFEKSYRAALQTPAVKSTSHLARMALHNAILKADPTVETILANMNAPEAQDQLQNSHQKRPLGIKFDAWLANYPATSVAHLTAADRQKLEQAHRQGIHDPTFMAAMKTARITLYNAMISIDPKIAPILTKAGIALPKSMSHSVTNSKVGSEVRVLGGDDDLLFVNDILDPAIEELKKETSTH
jgi:hypothetical protein